MQNSTIKGFKGYRPTKTVWFWSCVGVAAVTMAVGFGTGSWVTNGTALARAETSMQQGVASLAATICAKRFLAADDAPSLLAQLKETSSWRQGSFIEKGGWVTFADMDKPVSGAGSLCAKKVLANQDDTTTAPIQEG